nr:EAL domain-containing protein [Pseudoalteromonas luteoviolacea]
MQSDTQVTLFEHSFTKAEFCFESHQFASNEDAAQYINQRLCKELSKRLDSSLVRCSDIQVSAQIVSPQTSHNQSVRSDASAALLEVEPDFKTQLNDILVNKQLEPYWQSIQHVQSSGVFGYEALIRGPKNSQLHSPDQLFAAALASGKQNELEIQALLTHFVTHEKICRLQQPCMLTVNIAPKMLFSNQVNYVLLNHPYPEFICLELTEHVPVEDWAPLKTKMGTLRQLGYQIWLDDVGCGFFELKTIKIAQPDVAKLCITIINQLPENQQIISELKQVIQAVHQYGGKILAEGVENKAQLAAAKGIGIDLAQGYLFDKPSAVKIPE